LFLPFFFTVHSTHTPHARSERRNKNAVAPTNALYAYSLNYSPFSPLTPTNDDIQNKETKTPENGLFIMAHDKMRVDYDVIPD
jgi:hypothetical protein